MYLAPQHTHILTAQTPQCENCTTFLKPIFGTPCRKWKNLIWSINVFCVQISSLLKYQEIYNNLDLDLIESLSRIQIFDENSVHVVPYDLLFQDDERILQVMRKVQKWPQTTKGQHLPHLMSLMCIILAFSVISVLNDISGKIVEKAQLHYTITLQRYLK